MGGVLVIDDDPDIRDAVREFLTLEGFAVREASDGVQAEQVLGGEDVPSVIMLDSSMPQLNGRQFLDWLTRHPRFAAIQVIMASADRSLASHPRVAGMLQKPYEPNELLALLGRLSK